MRQSVTSLLSIFALLGTMAWKASGCAPLPLDGTDLRTGQKVTISAHSKKGIVAVFLSSKCPCSRGHETSLLRLQEAFSDFSFVGIHSNADEDPEQVRSHFAVSRFPFPILRDEGFRLANAFGALKTPHAFIIGPQKECLFNGGIDSSRSGSSGSALSGTKHYLEEALLSLRAGKEPQEKVVRTLGCIIQRS
jgi:hypothetical protein